MSEPLPVRIADARPAAGFRPIWQPARVEAAPEPPEPAVDRFADGYGQGFADAEQAFAAERARWTALIAACEAFQPEPSEALALLIARTVESLVRTIVGETAIDAGVLIDRAHRAAALVAEANSDRLLRLHPDDLALIGEGILPLATLADPELARGSLRIEDSAGWVEDGIGIHLEALREQLGLSVAGQ